ncbi:DUF3352 domain-containing protein [Candidatus Peregrinibacteria bacterium]|nr:DUF3352 domain-containing protein [Candidatus Peregrinibacteria bacterium]
MGKKSKAKKLLRQQMEAANAEKELKKGKNKPKKKEEKKIHFRINKKKIFGGILVLIMLAILVAVGYLIFERAFRAQPIAKFLPSESTVALLEINTNFDHTQLNKTFELLKNHPDYSKEKLIGYIEKLFNLNYEIDLKPWLGREAGVAYLNSAKDTNAVYTLFFAEVLSQNNVEKFLQKYSPVENVYIGNKTYAIKFPAGMTYVTFVGDYLFAGTNEQAIFQVIDAQNSTTEKLYATEKYRKVDNNLPLNRTAFVFFNFDQLSDGFLHELPFMDKISMITIKPFIKSFDAEGLALVALNKDFAIQTFLTLHSTNSNNSSYLSFEKKYNADLADYLSKDTLAFWGGRNLEAELQKTVSAFTGGQDSNRLIVDQILQAYTQRYFGQSTIFKDDILPLFKNEFAFAVEKLNNKNVYKFIFELDSAQTDAVKLHQLANNFASYGGIFEPKVVEHTLPDGTVGKEIVAAPEEITKNESNYAGTTIYELKMGKENWSLYYTVIGNLAIITNDPDSLKLSMDLTKSNGASLSSTGQFSEDIKPIIKGSDEVSYFDFDNILPLIFNKQDLPPILDIVSSFSSGKNYFDDGVVSINYLHIK